MLHVLQNKRKFILRGYDVVELLHFNASFFLYHWCVVHILSRTSADGKSTFEIVRANAYSLLFENDDNFFLQTAISRKITIKIKIWRCYTPRSVYCSKKKSIKLRFMFLKTTHVTNTYINYHEIKNKYFYKQKISNENKIHLRTTRAKNKNDVNFCSHSNNAIFPRLIPRTLALLQSNHPSLALTQV